MHGNQQRGVRAKLMANVALLVSGAAVATAVSATQLNADRASGESCRTMGAAQCAALYEAAVQ